MVRNIRVGRYCVELGANMRKFFRVTERKNGKYAGCLIIQTQHSESFKNALIFYPSGSFWIINRDIDSCLMMIAADPYTCAIRYGQEMGVCCRCGKKLTDDRSRWYGIGPECEQHFPEIINEVNNTRGVFVKE
jgi:hypothetical protein